MSLETQVQPTIAEDAEPEAIVGWMMERFANRRMALTTSFGMEGCALIDMVAKSGRALPVIYLDTAFLFPETYALRDRMVSRYPELEFQSHGTALTPAQQEEMFGPGLWARDPDLCCRLRKVEPMDKALESVDVWVTGLMRSQSAERAGLRVVEWDRKYKVIRVNPLAGWNRAKIWEYVRQHDVPYNELHERGYPSIGCTHCTIAVKGASPSDYSREGRWSGTFKTECGLHSDRAARDAASLVGEASR